MHVRLCLAHQFACWEWYVRTLQVGGFGCGRGWGEDWVRGETVMEFLSHITILCVWGWGVCGGIICYDGLSTCTPTPKTAPVPAFLSQRPLLNSITFWMGTLGDGGAAVCLVVETRWGFLGQAEVGCPLCQPWSLQWHCWTRDRWNTHTAHRQPFSFEQVIMSWEKREVSLPSSLLLSFHLRLCLSFVWLVSIPIIARLSDHWVTSEIESTWQPESARTASRVQISHPGEALLSRDDDRSMKWTREWCTRGVRLSQLDITNTPDDSTIVWLRVLLCCVCLCSAL